MLVIALQYDGRAYVKMPDGSAMVITVVTSGKRVRLGFQAPKGIEIRRAEHLTERERAELEAKANT